MSYNNRQNRATRRGIRRNLELALTMFYRGELTRSEEFLRSAAGGFSIWGARGLEWDSLSEAYRRTKIIIDAPCECWYCAFTPEQKSVVRKQTDQKFAQLNTEYRDEENNYTGAFAEVVFGMHFGLEVNLQPGLDGGIDFSVPCRRYSDGVATIDVKGTQHGALGRPSGASNFPRQHHWRERANHIYVLLHVIGRNHVFFSGYAFGNDPMFSTGGLINSVFERWEAPRATRPLSELKALIEDKSGLPVRDQPYRPDSLAADALLQSEPLSSQLDDDWNLPAVLESTREANSSGAKPTLPYERKREARIIACKCGNTLQCESLYLLRGAPPVKHVAVKGCRMAGANLPRLFVCDRCKSLHELESTMRRKARSL